MVFDYLNVKLKYSALVLGAALTFVGCSEEEEAALITPSPSSEVIFSEGINFMSTGGESEITFTTNKNWSIQVSSSDGRMAWCTVSPQQGVAGENTVGIRASASEEYDGRSVTLSLIAGDLTKDIVVSQSQMDAVVIPVSEYVVEPEGGSIEVEVQANVEYWETISGEETSWIHAVPGTRALESGFYAFVIDPYDGYDAREGEIHFSANTESGGRIMQTVRIVQNGRAILNIAQKEYAVPDEGGQIEIQVESNFDCKVVDPQVDWISLAQVDGAYTSTFHYNIAPNLTMEERTAEIVFYDEKETVKETVRIVQEGLGLIINEQSCEMPVGGQLQLTYSINSELTQTGLVWSSSDENVVTITQDGLVTAVSRGTVVITLSTTDGITATCEITVYELTDKIDLSFDKGGLVIINGYVTGLVNSTIINNSVETIYVRTVKAYDGSTGFLVGQSNDVNATLAPGQSMNLGLECNNVYLPIFVWTFTVNDVEYSVTHQFPVW